MVANKQAGVSRRAFLAASAAGLGLLSLPAWAQLDIEITGVGSQLFPISVPAFSGTGSAPGSLSSVIAADLVRSGKFRQVGSTAEVSYTQVLNPDPQAFRAENSNAAVIGSIAPKGAGRWEISCKLLDVVSGKLLDNFVNTSTTGNLRMAAHQIADRIYFRLTGTPGCFASRIAYVQNRGGVYELVIADSDGENPRVALRSREPIISPTWAPNGTSLAYVSFESRKPVVYIHELMSGHRRVVANFPGNNSAPAFSPDGSRLAVALSRDGGTQIYLMSTRGGSATRFTTGAGINTEPVFSPDGAWIYFTSDRGGNPQIYRKPVSGGKASRVTFSVGYAVSPALSPDGKKLAYIARSRGGFQVNVLDLASGSNMAVTKTSGDESPSFSPNGELIVYATVSGRQGVLAMASADGSMSSRLRSRGGSIREPAWGPLIR